MAGTRTSTRTSVAVFSRAAALRLLLILCGSVSAQPPVVSRPERLAAPAGPAEKLPATGAKPAPYNPGQGPSATAPNVPFPFPPEFEGIDLNRQADGDVAVKSASCQSCHVNSHDPHYKSTVRLGCTD